MEQSCLWMSKLLLTCLARQLQVSLPSPWCCLAPFPATLFGSGRILPINICCSLEAFTNLDVRN